MNERLAAYEEQVAEQAVDLIFNNVSSVYMRNTQCFGVYTVQIYNILKHIEKLLQTYNKSIYI